MEENMVAMLLAFFLDAVVGWPRWLYLRIGHPVTWVGRMINAGDRSLNREADSRLLRRICGIAVAGFVIILTAGMTFGISWLLPDGWPKILLTGLLAWPLVAARSLHDHVCAVSRPLATGDLPTARKAVSMIVGRNPKLLNDAGVARAAMESLAENSSDGIVAPLFWGMLLGLPGIAAYKAINTMDSMIGHRTPRHEAFGWAAARIDDVANLIPARLTGLLFVLVSGRPAAALRVMLRDAPSHRSPNAGWPEAAFAGALGIRLSGPRTYADHVAEEPWLNGAAPDPCPDDLVRGLVLYRRAMAAVAVLLAVIVLTTGWP
ncbi:cobalamin biosynthesis protein CobD/CbiB [Acetobacter oeni LMG 21952]|nr:adenosylcobinamide-phosphate synthase CbiB [Acetobacter oeni]GBR10395.1 cobalamin biosynthesis protein CobD/CbiB [Acetobacter oeni LMG 21952]